MNNYTTELQGFRGARHELEDGSLVYSYGNCTLEINRNRYYPESHGKYVLSIERDNWISDDLAALEARLFYWARQEL